MRSTVVRAEGELQLWLSKSSSPASARSATLSTALSSPTRAPVVTAVRSRPSASTTPKEEPSLIDIDSERAQYWLSVGAQPTEPVEALLKITGDWQKFKGLPGTEGTLRVKEAKPTKLELFQAALAQAENEPVAEAITPKKKKAAKADEAKAEDTAADAEAPAADAEAADK